MWSYWLVFCDCCFQSVCPLMEKDKRLMEASWWERLTDRKLVLVLMGRAMLSKSLIQLSVDEQGCVPPVIYLGPDHGRGNEDNGDLLQKVACIHCSLSPPNPAAGHLRPTYFSSKNKSLLVNNQDSNSILLLTVTPSVT